VRYIPEKKELDMDINYRNEFANMYDKRVTGVFTYVCSKMTGRQAQCFDSSEKNATDFGCGPVI
jgi:hypothetical protein